MAAAQEKSDQKKTDELPIPEKLNDFIQKNRKTLLAGLIAVLVILAGFIIGLVVRDNLVSRALNQVDAFENRYMELSIDTEGEISGAALAVINALLEDLEVFAARNSGFAAARSYFIVAKIYEELKNWAEAQTAWAASARAAAGSYLAPVSLFNAAAAAEEQGNIESAIEFYTQALNYGNTFPAAARAQFSIGRLQESRNRGAALEAYRNLVNRWPNDPLWTNLAQSRIMVLSDD